MVCTIGRVGITRRLQIRLSATRPSRTWYCEAKGDKLRIHLCTCGPDTILNNLNIHTRATDGICARNTRLRLSSSLYLKTNICAPEQAETYQTNTLYLPTQSYDLPTRSVTDILPGKVNTRLLGGHKGDTYGWEYGDITTRCKGPIKHNQTTHAL